MSRPKYSRQLNLRLTAKQLRTWERRAKAEGRTLAEWARNVLDEECRWQDESEAVATPPDDNERLAQALDVVDEVMS